MLVVVIARIRRPRPLRRRLTAGVSVLLLGVTACTSGPAGTTSGPPSRSAGGSADRSPVPRSSAPSPTATPSPTGPAGQFTVAFAGDVHFSGRLAPRLAADPATIFGPAAAVLRKADFTMVNLETAIATGGQQQNKSFTFRAPPTALTALRDAGIDLATEANNHGADYGRGGLQETVAAIAASKFPVIGIGADAAQAYAPYETAINGVKVAFLAATQVQDETLANWTAGTSSPGVASAFDPRLVDNVRAEKAKGYVVVVYLHWGTEYTYCPNQLQSSLARRLSAAGAAAVIGTHAHVLQGAGWTASGTYVEYGLGNYLWWMNFGNKQDDNGVLTLTFRGGRVVADDFAPAHLNALGEPVPATGSERTRILDQWNGDRACTGLLADPPR